MASCAASTARSSPVALPVPMRAAPRFDMTVRTSAKSTFTSPVTEIRSEIPWVAWRSTSSAFFSAWRKVISFPTTASRRSFGTTIIVSTARRSSRSPISAYRILFLPSKWKGRVTIAMQSDPISRAMPPMIGAAPVPVPPPIPAVTKTRSAPSIDDRISSALSDIACRPISGRAPAPRPRVSSFPIWTLRWAPDSFNAWASVLTAMNSTPSSSSSIMRLTALPPAPPTPTTFIFALRTPFSSNAKTMCPLPPVRKTPVATRRLLRRRGSLPPTLPPRPATHRTVPAPRQCCTTDARHSPPCP